jgi:hypothetical protein
LLVVMDTSPFMCCHLAVDNPVLGIISYLFS